MSEDWLVTSPRPITVEDLLLGMHPWSDRVSLRADDTGAYTVVVDAHDTALVWIAASQRVHRPREALLSAGLDTTGTVDPTLWPDTAPEASSYWTEVIQPASPYTSASRIDAASVAHAIATVVGGATQRMSRMQGAESGHGTLALPAADMPCDVLTESSAVFLQTRPILMFTLWVAMAMDWATARGVAPVFLTPGLAHLSPVMHHFATRGGCLWIRQGAEGQHNGATGRAVAWDGTAFVTSQAPPWQTSTDNHWDVVLEGERLRPTASQDGIGDFVEAMHDACAVERPHSWGVSEPPDLAWDVSQVGDHVRAACLAQSRFFFRSAAGEGIATVVPQPTGIQEQVTCIVRADHVMPRATNLSRLGEQLLRTGSDLCVLGYRQPTLPQPGQSGHTGNVLPGVIGFVPARFGGFDASALTVDLGPGVAVPGVEVSVNQHGVVLAFGAPREPTDDSSAALIAVWERTLHVLAEHDSVRIALSSYRGRSADDLHL